jgi:regulator of sigma E protease
MSKSKGLINKKSQGLFWFLVFAIAIYLIVRHISVFGNVLMVLIGFGVVVIVHEFGHFIIAKLSGIKVEAFSIFMPPTLLGIRKTKEGFKFRILPTLFAKGSDGSVESSINETDSAEQETNQADETEYRIGLIPFGGYVKMLGQDDTGPIKSTDDPRSFANKPASTRIAVIAAGVTFNVISAVIIFMIVFLVGISLPPAVVGEVMPNSPAAQAGLKPGDEIIKIAGKSEDLDFSNILLAAALSDDGEKVALTVRHEDGSIEDFALVAEQLSEEPMRVFGIAQPVDVTIADVSGPNALLKKTGLLPRDRIKSVDGTEVRNYWELEEIVRNALVPEVALVAERAKGSGDSELIKSQIRLDLLHTEVEVKTESDLNHICYIVPRLKIIALFSKPVPVINKLLSVPSKIINKLKVIFVKVPVGSSGIDTSSKLQIGDVILAAGNIENPTFKELRDVTTEYEDKELPVKVLRMDANGVERTLTITVKPWRLRGSDRVFFGIAPALDAEHPVVAKTIALEGGPKLDIPRGAVITAVDGKKVLNFYDIIREIRQHTGERIKIDYLDGETPGSVTLDISAYKNPITVKSTFAEYIPFKTLERTYRATGPIQAITMGYRRTVMFVAQTYVTIKRLIGGVISPKLLSGPVGIIAFSYRIVAEQPLVYYVYFLGLISAAIAVFNLLPLPPLDGGLIVLMLIEKIKGSALSERTQGVIAYTGWVLIGTLLIYVTFNDVVRNFFS